MAHERHSKTSNPDCPSSQEPRITGNSGNTGNGLVWRGLQPLPPYKKSGNNWQRIPHFQHKRSALSFHLVITVAGKKTVATVWQHRQRLEDTVYGAVAIVAAVAGVFRIRGTMDHRRSDRGDAMSLLSGLLDHMPPAIAGTDSPIWGSRTQPRPRLVLANPVERTPRLIKSPHASAATATPEWRQASDQYLNHIMVCRSCYAPNGRHCTAGAHLRACYDNTPMEAHQ